MDPSKLLDAGMPTARSRLLHQLAELPTLSMAELSERWQLLIGTPVPTTTNAI